MTREKILAVFREVLLIAVVAGVVYGMTYALASAIGGVLGKKLPVIIVILVLGRHFYKSTICYWSNAGILSCGIFSVFAMRQLCQLKILRETMLNELHVWISLIILVVMLINIVNKRFYRGIMTLILSGSWLMLCFIYPLYYTAEKSWFSTDAVLAIMQSNPSESSSYLANHITLAGILLLVIFFGVLSALICLNVKYGGIRKLTGKKYILMSLMILYSVINVVNMTSATRNIQENSYVTHSFVGARQQQMEYDKFKEMVSDRNNMMHGLQVDAEKASGLYVLIIGESQTREHMSAYGYDGRDTTPWLQEMMNTGRVISFGNAYSCHTHTVPVLTYALTAKNQYNDRQVENSASIIDVAKAAGYHTIWLSNQSHYGAYDTPISIIADSADEKVFIEKNVYGTVSDYYDDALIPELDNMSIDGNTLLVIHLMGCHGGYGDRYPREAGIFSGNDNATLYDNAVYYNDMVMKGLYEKLSQCPDFQGMIYFADHGEEPTELGHNWDRFVPCMAEIPMYMIFSPQYQASHEARYGTLQEHSKEYFTNDLIYNTLLGIMGIKESGSYEPKNDISSQQYDGNAARFTTGYGAKHIEEIMK